MVIQHNIPATNAYRNLTSNRSGLSKNLEKLSSGFPFVRVDFYETNRQLLFGEMTFYPSAGFDGRRRKALEDYLNKRLVLPQK